MRNEIANVKIAQVCMPFLPVPPKNYGGVERVISYLTEALVLEGHDVTLFASGDSQSSARILAPCDKAVGIGSEGRLLYSTTLGVLADLTDQFDAIHFHFTDWTMLPYVKALQARCLITYHMPIELSEATRSLFNAHPNVPLVSVSNSQRRNCGMLNWQCTIHNGLPLDLYSIQENPNGYCAYLGRLGPSKGPDKAIDIALAAKVPLKLAGPIQQPYFDERIAPRLRPHEIEYVGEIDDIAKQSFLGGADSFLFPTQVEEAFGLVMIEAMSCGTPVIAFDHGAAREVVTSGVTGFVVSNTQEGASLLKKAATLSRQQCRAEFERRFAASRMCREYCQAYELIASRLP